MKEVIEPVAGKLVVRPNDDYTSIAGLILPDSAKRPHSGTVLAVGPGVNNALGGGDTYHTGRPPIMLKEGAKVVYEFAAGNTFTLKDGSPHGYDAVVLDVKDILGLVVEK